ncbi:MAG: efflux transporter outer membrane subunit [Candidatus Acidiferrales bacterium]
MKIALRREACSASVERKRKLIIGAGGFLLGACFFVSGCTVGPAYVRPTAPTPTATSYKEFGNWQTTQPNDAAPRGKWWEVFQDARLSELEDKVDVSNQNLKAAEAQYTQARAAVRFYRSGYFPVVSTGPSASRQRQSQNKALFSAGEAVTYNDYLLPVDVSYEPDIWGQVRRQVESARAQMQASAADLATVNLSLHAELAMDYFQLRGLDTESQLLNNTVQAFQKTLQLTQDRFKGGLASAVDVAQAQTQLETTRAQAIDVGVQRAAYEHAVAVLTGEPPSDFSLAASPLSVPPPVVPPGLPSQLLERRPDIASAERQMASANAQIGVAKTAYYPTVSLSGGGGFETAGIGNLLSGPSALWAIGASAFGTIFEGGRRHAVTAEAQAAYTQTVANYRQTVLTAFQDVEDNLAAQRILEQEAATEAGAVAAAEHSLDLSLHRYTGGVTSYLEVTTAQGLALSDERTAADILTRRMVASVLLIKALGGGWTTANLPAD